MTGEGKSFTIKDRRLFTADGELRSDEDQESTETSPPVSEVAPPDPSHADEPHESLGEVDFAGFLMSLGGQALEALAAEPPALPAVRTMVAILEMLRDKTQGRRSPEEDQVLEALLYQLRLGYVERSKTGRA